MNSAECVRLRTAAPTTWYRTYPGTEQESKCFYGTRQRKQLCYALTTNPSDALFCYCKRDPLALRWVKIRLSSGSAIAPATLFDDVPAVHGGDKWSVQLDNGHKVKEDEWMSDCRAKTQGSYNVSNNLLRCRGFWKHLSSFAKIKEGWKCKYLGGLRVFEKLSVPTADACFEECLRTPECRYFSHRRGSDGFCVGCSDLVLEQGATDITTYSVRTPFDPPLVGLVAWGAVSDWVNLCTQPDCGTTTAIPLVTGSTIYVDVLVQGTGRLEFTYLGCSRGGEVNEATLEMDRVDPPMWQTATITIAAICGFTKEEDVACQVSGEDFSNVSTAGFESVQSYGAKIGRRPTPAACQTECTSRAWCSAFVYGKPGGNRAHECWLHLQGCNSKVITGDFDYYTKKNSTELGLGMKLTQTANSDGEYVSPLKIYRLRTDTISPAVPKWTDLGEGYCGEESGPDNIPTCTLGTPSNYIKYCDGSQCGVADYQSCQSLCAGNADCVSATYSELAADNQGHACYGKCVLRKRRCEDDGGPRPVHVLVGYRMGCANFNTITIKQYTEARTDTNTVDKCGRKCIETTGCVGFEFGQDDTSRAKDCSLLSGVCLLESNSVWNQYSIAYSQDQPIPKYILVASAAMPEFSHSQCSNKQSILIEQFGATNDATNDVNKCRNKCSATQGCVGFAFGARGDDTGVCSLWNGPCYNGGNGQDMDQYALVAPGRKKFRFYPGKGCSNHNGDVLIYHNDGDSDETNTVSKCRTKCVATAECIGFSAGVGTDEGKCRTRRRPCELTDNDMWYTYKVTTSGQPPLYQSYTIDRTTTTMTTQEITLNTLQRTRT